MGGQKGLLEIDLNENLRRSRDELRGKIERLGEPQDGDASSADDLESRLRELRALKQSIDALTKKSQGENSELLIVSQLTSHDRGREGVRRI